MLKEWMKLNPLPFLWKLIPLPFLWKNNWACVSGNWESSSPFPLHQGLQLHCYVSSAHIALWGLWMLSWAVPNVENIGVTCAGVKSGQGSQMRVQSQWYPWRITGALFLEGPFSCLLCGATLTTTWGCPKKRVTLTCLRLRWSLERPTKTGCLGTTAGASSAALKVFLDGCVVRTLNPNHLK